METASLDWSWPSNVVQIQILLNGPLEFHPDGQKRAKLQHKMLGSETTFRTADTPSLHGGRDSSAHPSLLVPDPKIGSGMMSWNGAGQGTEHSDPNLAVEDLWKKIGRGNDIFFVQLATEEF